MKILVTGANGQLGRCLQKASLQYEQFDFHFMGREHLPIDNHELTRKILIALKPDIVINAAAYTAVDRAEAEFIIASNINGYAVGNLAAVCAELKSRFIHISTDYVFDGEKKEPYSETDYVNPLNIYGKSKLLGEQLAQSENPTSLIIRTSWVYSPYGSNFVKTMIRLMATRDSISVVDDQTGSPTYAYDLASVLLQVSTYRTNWHSGIYHYSNIGNITWYQFAAAIKKARGYHCALKPITTCEFPTAAPRPNYSVMNCEKIVQQLGVELKPWDQGLTECLMKLEEAT